MGRLDSKVAIVTGAGGGIGRQHVLALAAEGAAVVVNDLGGARDGTGHGTAMADQVVAEIEQHGGRAVADYSNVADAASGEAILATAIDAFGRVDVLVNNAGILRDKTLTKMTEDLWDAVLAVHLKGTYNVARPVFIHMKESGRGGVIINTSSTSGLIGNFGQCNYGAAKAGIAGFSRCLALEGAKYRVRVHVLAPIAITRMTEDLPGMQADAVKEKFGDDLVSPLVVFLASDEAAEISSKTFLVGGGRIAEMRVDTNEGATKSEDGGLWTVDEVEAAMRPGAILFPEQADTGLGI